MAAEESTIELVYEGGPRGLAALVRALRDEGLEVDYEQPQEYRGADMAQEVVVALVASATGTVAKALTTKALDKVRARWPGIKVRGKHEKL
jgi:hypothetical protein